MIDRIKCKNNLLNVLSEKCENEPDLNGIMKLESSLLVIETILLCPI